MEVGFFNDPTFDWIGFILYDGGYSGNTILYQRNGLEHSWYWKGYATKYSFVIKPDGTGIIMTLTVPEGEKSKPSAVYRCYQRK